MDENGMWDNGEVGSITDVDSNDDGLLDGQEVYGWRIKFIDEDGVKFIFDKTI
ncbi:MAG: hypothetical protein AB1779_08430 [Candidatus Thermoplasmatota archaeon]